MRIKLGFGWQKTKNICFNWIFRPLLKLKIFFEILFWKPFPWRCQKLFKIAFSYQNDSEIYHCERCKIGDKKIIILGQPKAGQDLKFWFLGECICSPRFYGEHGKMLQSIVKEVCSPILHKEQGKMLHSLVESIFSPSFYKSMQNCCYILGPMAGQEASGSARPLYWSIYTQMLVKKVVSSEE